MQALLLKASAAPKEAMADITATALDMLKQDPTQYQVLSAAAHLLQKSKEQGTPVPGAILEVGPAQDYRLCVVSVSSTISSCQKWCRHHCIASGAVCMSSQEHVQLAHCNTFAGPSVSCGGQPLHSLSSSQGSHSEPAVHLPAASAAQCGQ